MTVAKLKTKAELILNLRYQMRVHLLHCRLFRRLRGVLAFITVLGGSSTIVSALQGSPVFLMAAAIVVALVGFTDWITDPAQKAAQHEIHRSKAQDLLQRAGAMSIAELDTAATAIDTDIHLQFESLRAVAYNNALKSGGFEDGIRLETGMQRLFRALA